MSKKQVTPPARPTLIHQIDSVRRQHRIVLMRDGRPDEGPWFELHQIAVYKTYLAGLIEKDGLPEGIFTVTRKAYEVLA
jgi:hypothetical protein